VSAGEYAEADEDGRNRRLVERVENILANTTSQFIETHQSARDTGSSEHGGSQVLTWTADISILRL